MINLGITLFIPDNIQPFCLHYLKSPQLFGKQGRRRNVSWSGLLLCRQIDEQTKSQGKAPAFQLRGQEPLRCSIWRTLTGLFSMRRMYKLSATALHTCHSKSDDFFQGILQKQPLGWSRTKNLWMPCRWAVLGPQRERGTAHVERYQRSWQRQTDTIWNESN